MATSTEIKVEHLRVSSPQDEIISPDSLLTSYQVGSLLQVNPSSVNKWIKDGRIPAFRTPGGHRRIRASDLVSFLNKHSMPIPQKLIEAGKRRLLVVDDDSKQLSALQRLLKPYDSRLSLCLVNNGIDALVQVGSFKPHLILLDVYMDEIDGIEVCRRLKENPDTSHIKVVIATGQMSDEIKSQAQEVGAALSLSKPVDINHILAELGMEGVQAASA